MPTKSDMQFHVAPNPFFKAWADLVIKHRWLFMLLNLVVTGFMIHQTVTRLTVDNSTQAFLSDRANEIIVLEELHDNFGQDYIYQVLIEGDVFSLPYLNRLKALHDELAVIDLKLESLGQRKRVSKTSPKKTDDSEESFSGFADDEGWGDEGGGTIVEEIISLINVRQTTWEGGGLKVGGLLDEWPSESDLPELRKRVLSDKVWVGQVIGKEGRHSAIIIRTDFMNQGDRNRVCEEIEQISSKHDAEGFHVSVAGSPALDAWLNRTMLNDFRRLTVIALLVMIFLLTLIYRHPLGVIGPLLAVVQSAFWTLGIMAMCEVPMTIFTNVLPGFLACVGIGSSVHIQSVYRDARGRNMPNKESIVFAVATTGVPVLYTTLTTGLGLISFRFASMDAIVNMGTFGALGIMMTLIQALVFLPIMLYYNKKSLLGVKLERQTSDLLDRFLSFCNNLSRSKIRGTKVSHVRRYTTLVVSAVFTIAVGLGALTLNVYHNPLSWIPPGKVIKKAIEDTDRYIGGTANVAIVIEPKPGRDLKDRELLLRMEKLEQHIESYKDPKSGEHIVGSTISLLDVVRESWHAVNGLKDGYYKIPDTERGVADMFTLFENAAPDQLRRMATVDFMNSLMTIRVKWMDAWSYKPLTEHITQGIEEIIGDRATVKVTGSIFSVFTVVSALLMDLLRSFGVAFIAITLMMMFLLRDIRMGLIAMVPNLLPVVSILGVMGYASIPLDTATLIIASIVIGIAVDDTIHFLHQVRVHRQAHGDVDLAIAHAFSHTGRAMVSTSTILVLGFCVFLAATMYPLQRFGLLAGLAIIFALLFDLVVGPALLRSVYGTRLKEKGV
ncbi:MAG: MMPL family transporter [Proteobacteria bacterium]|nr:MMPL family transporter [Pseudomonadota bacterium]